MTTPLQNGLIAETVKADAHSFFTEDKRLFFKAMFCGFEMSHARDMGFDFFILGTCTKETIDFDVTPHIENIGYELTDEPRYKNYDQLPVDWFEAFSNPVLSFRSMLSAAGITEYDKLVILKQI